MFEKQLPDHGLNQRNEFTQQARIERYKFVLLELARLSENTHKHTRYLLAIFPAFASAVIALKFGDKGLESNTKLFFSHIAIGFLCVFTLASLFIVASVLADIASWIDYRKEEVALVNMMGGDFRKVPEIKNFWRWYETYLITFVAIFVTASWALYFFLFNV